MVKGSLSRRPRPRYRGVSLTSNAAPLAFAAARAARSRLGFSYTRTQTQSRNQSTSGRGVTTQHDRKLIYRKKRMPSRKKRGWKRFKNKVHAIAEKDFGSRTILFNTQILSYNQTVDTQGCLTLALYSQASTNGWLNDLVNISGGENVNANPTAAAGQTIEASTKYLFQSAIMDITIRNTSGVITAPGAPPVSTIDGNAKMELDIYEISVRKDMMSNVTNYINLSNMLQAEEANVKVLGGVAANLQIISRGATPWELPYCISRFGLKIWKKTKFFIPAGDTITYQVRDPKRRTITQRDMNQELGFNRPGWTKIYYLIYKLVPGVTVGAGVGAFVSRIDVGCTRKYLYKIDGLNDDRDYYSTVNINAVSPS